MALAGRRGFGPSMPSHCSIERPDHQFSLALPLRRAFTASGVEQSVSKPDVAGRRPLRRRRPSSLLACPHSSGRLANRGLRRRCRPPARGCAAGIRRGCCRQAVIGQLRRNLLAQLVTVELQRCQVGQFRRYLPAQLVPVKQTSVHRQLQDTTYTPKEARDAGDSGRGSASPPGPASNCGLVSPRTRPCA